ncbi:nuclear transport factor 2 family protein [Thauera sp.]|jgi:3-phenylpropionate/cinnamic acid dioxygenase small subunit|uniref:nuclear transport factor 2 family protein n=1 Tax=Thauera sp. TaxID=1905334 RepID=UPI002A360DB3|nr:nuclear transport factor 2 family protein [Thauera sp.]MDX9887168.1 nuclear transport factor 2 family protein [Thauera sp.]
MDTSATAICNLLYRYAEAIDEGRLKDAAALFLHARIEAGAAGPLDADGLLALWRKILVIHPCGTPRTRHLVTNPILDIDEATGTAQVRSCFTVMQATDDFPLQIIASGRYHDRFARIGGQWCFVERDYRQLDFIGDLSQHLRMPLKQTQRL